MTYCVPRFPTGCRYLAHSRPPVSALPPKFVFAVRRRFKSSGVRYPSHSCTKDVSKGRFMQYECLYTSEPLSRIAISAAYDPYIALDYGQAVDQPLLKTREPPYCLQASWLFGYYPYPKGRGERGVDPRAGWEGSNSIYTTKEPLPSKICRRLGISIFVLSALLASFFCSTASVPVHFPEIRKYILSQLCSIPK
jgi:hypothetical protein